MAEPQSASPAAEQAKAQSNAQKTIEKTVDGERRSFDSGAEALRTAGQTGGAAARDMARAGAETTRQLAETTHRTSREIGEHWRASLEPIASAQQELNRWFDDMFRVMTGFSAFPTLRVANPLGVISPAPLFGMPATDVRECAETYTLAIEAPGMTREEIELTVSNGAIVVSGHKSESRDDTRGAYRLSERRFGRFERRFPLPPDVDPASIEASCRDGVLKVVLPKRSDASNKPARIQIS